MKLKSHRFNTSTRNIISEKKAVELLQPHFGIFWRCFQEAWASWEEFGTTAPSLRKPLDSTTRANFMWDHIKENVKKHFKAVSGVTVRDKGHFFALDVKGAAVLRFKKLTSDYHSSNVATTRQMDLALQIDRQNNFLPGIPDAATWLTCGYVLDKHETAIEECVATCIVGNEIKFKIALAPETPKEGPVRQVPVQQPRRAKVLAKAVPQKKANQENAIK